MKEMRIVGWTPGLSVNIQLRNYIVTKNCDWKQVSISEKEFDELMRSEYPAYYEEFEEKNDEDETAIEFFYHYGETPKMRREGTAYIYS